MVLANYGSPKGSKYELRCFPPVKLHLPSAFVAQCVPLPQNRNHLLNYTAPYYKQFFLSVLCPRFCGTIVLPPPPPPNLSSERVCEFVSLWQSDKPRPGGGTRCRWQHTFVLSPLPPPSFLEHADTLTKKKKKQLREQGPVCRMCRGRVGTWHK